MRDKVCDACGAEARVHLLEGYRGGLPAGRSLCFDCADLVRRVDRVGGLGIGRSRRGLSIILACSGVALAALGLLGDRLGIGDTPGIGWLQRSGLAVGALFVVLGALLRIDLIAVAGTILFGLAAIADLLKGAAGDVIGWKQQSAILVGAFITCLGVMLGLRSRSRERANPR